MLVCARSVRSKAKRYARARAPIIAKRTMTHGYPPIFSGFVAPSIGKFDITLETYPKWYRSLVDWSVKSGFTSKYLGWMGYRKFGLRFEDILIESPEIARALTLLPKDVLSDRDDRIKQAFVLSAGGDMLPKEQQTKPQDDVPYLAPYLHLVVQENLDRKHFRPR